MNGARKFQTIDVLSITTGVMLSIEGSTRGIRMVLEHMCGRPLRWCDLVQVADEMRPEIIRQHPWIGKIDLSEIPSGAAAAAWAERITAKRSTVWLRPAYELHTPLPVDHVEALAQAAAYAAGRQSW